MGRLRQEITNWIEQQTAHSVRSVERMVGSTSTSLYRCYLSGNRHSEPLVLRVFDNAAWLAEEPDLARHEAEALRKLADSGIPGPRLLAFDEMGAVAGTPLVLMTYLGGRVELRPANLHLWLMEMANTLAQIHALPPGNFAWHYYRYNPPATLSVPTWSVQPSVWKQTLAIARQKPPPVVPCFLHRDYHPTNILWTDNQLSGVVDWPNACIGPAGIDVGHCRLNLALLMGVAVADQFLKAYQAAAPAFGYDPYWDVVAVLEFLPGPPGVYPPWQEFGITGLTDELVKTRYEELVKCLVGKVMR